QASAAGRLPRQDRGARAGDCEWPGTDDRHALGRRRQALQCLLPARSRCRCSRPVQGEPAELRRVRRSQGRFIGASARGGEVPGRVSFRGVRIGLPICEDVWTEWGRYENVVECLAETGAELMVVPNGSPYSRDKEDVRLNLAVTRVTESDLPIIYINQVGGQD